MSRKLLTGLNLVILAASLITLFAFGFRLADSEEARTVNGNSFLIALAIVSAASLFSLNNLKK